MILLEPFKLSTQKELPIVYAPARQGEIRFSYGDPSKAAEKLDFTAKVSLLEGLNSLINH